MSSKPWMITIALCALTGILWYSTSFITFDSVLLLLRSRGPQYGSNDKFNPKHPRTILAFILSSIGASVCSAGGLGGGGLFVPMFNLLLRFDTGTSASLSNFMIFGGMIASTLWSFFQRNPSDPSRPLIDFDAALIMQPNILLGISLGVLCNVMFPGWLIALILTVTLCFVTMRSFRSGCKMWRAETELRIEKYDMEEVLLDQDGTDPDEVETKVAILSSSWRACCVRLPIAKLVALLLVWLFFVGVQVFRGTKTSEGYFHLEVCGSGYWLITASQLPVTVLFTACTVWRARKSTSIQSRVHLSLPVMTFFAGILSGLLGLGGGMLINPVLMEIGLPPQVTAATSAFMVFFSSPLSVVQYWLMGRLPVDYALWFSTICFTFSLVGLTVVQRVVRRYGRESVIVLLVASVTGLSAILMVVFGGLDVWNQYMDGDYMGFRSAC